MLNVKNVEAETVIFYRYDQHLYESGPRVCLIEFKMWSETPCGYWIIPQWDYEGEFKRWVSKTARKRYAYPTIEEALTSFKARKKRQIIILTYQLKNAKKALEIADENLEAGKWKR